jgi:hypothetical protein
LPDTIRPENLVKLIQPTRAAALLLLAALAACSDAPTGSAIPAADQPAAFNTAPTVTVTDSGGDPLISWGALSGATSYTVEYIESRTIIIKATLDTEQEESVTTIANTTATSHLDTPHVYTGDTMCTSYGTFQTRMTWYRYRVTAHYPTGTASTLVPAPVSPC